MLRLLAASLFLAGFLLCGALLLAGALLHDFRLLCGRLLARAPALCCTRRLLAFLATDGALCARNISVPVDEVDVVGVHLEATVSDLFGTSLGNSRLLSLDLPNRSVLH